MHINDYILKEIKTLTLSDSVKSAKKLCKNLPITHVTVLKNNKLLGCFLESDILTIENKKSYLQEYSDLLVCFSSDKKTSLLALLKIFADNDTNIIPVLDAEKNYLGYYELNDVLDVFANNPFLFHDGETLIIEKQKVDASMSEVVQIVEANNVKLLGVYISSETNDKIQITLKVITDEMNELIQTFRRYDYHVITTHEDDVYLDDLKNRSDYLQKYLNM